MFANYVRIHWCYCSDGNNNYLKAGNFAILRLLLLISWIVMIYSMLDNCFYKVMRVRYKLKNKNKLKSIIVDHTEISLYLWSIILSLGWNIVGGHILHRALFDVFFSFWKRFYSAYFIPRNIFYFVDNLVVHISWIYIYIYIFAQRFVYDSIVGQVL